MQTGPRTRTVAVGIPLGAQSRTSAGGSQERTALARLAWALGRTLHLAARLYAATGKSAPDLKRLEASLAAATLPEEYVDIARQVAAIELPTGGASGSTTVLASLRKALVTVARSLSATAVAAELDLLRKAYEEDLSEDVEPLLLSVQHLGEALAVTRASSDVLNEGLRDVQGGIRQLVEKEDQSHSRIRATRERIASASSSEDLVAARGALLSETESLERVLEERRAALGALEEQSRNARRRADVLIAALADATTAATMDPLTGLGNRRSMAERVEELGRGTGSTGVLVLDIDFFKKVNDTHGHGIGDRVLAHVAGLLRTELRGDDHGFRIGGEEFVAILAKCDLEGALRTAERVRARIEANPVGVLGRALPATVSIGVATWTPPSKFDAAVERADAALYEAKRSGRNRCVGRSAGA